MWWRRIAVRRRVVVNMKGGTAFEAILWKRKGPYLILRDALYMEPGVKPVQVDGEVIITKSDVAWIQLPNSERR